MGFLVSYMEIKVRIDLLLELRKLEIKFSLESNYKFALIR